MALAQVFGVTTDELLRQTPPAPDSSPKAGFPCPAGPDRPDGRTLWLAGRGLSRALRSGTGPLWRSRPVSAPADVPAPAASGFSLHPFGGHCDPRFFLLAATLILAAGILLLAGGIVLAVYLKRRGTPKTVDKPFHPL